MTRRTVLVLCVAIVAGGAVAGFSRASAGEGTSTHWEYGVFRTVWRHEVDSDKRESAHAWVTSAEEEREQDIGGLWSRLDIEGAPRNDASDLIRVLDQLSSQGWELVTRRDAGLAGTGATAVAVSYVLRRPK